MVKQEILKRVHIELDQKKTVKHLGVWTGEDVSFEEHIEYLVQSSKIRTGMVHRVFNPFSTRSIHGYKFSEFIFTITQQVTKISDSSLWHMKA